MLFLNKFSSKAKFACFSRLKHFVPHILFQRHVASKNVTKHSVSTHFAVAIQIFLLNLQFFAYSDSVAFCEVEILVPHILFHGLLLKKTQQEHPFQRNLSVSHKFYAYFCNFAVFAYSVQFSFFCMFNFCFSHSVSTTSYFKKRNETQRFNAFCSCNTNFFT